MSSLVTIADVQALVAEAKRLDETQLQAIIDREEAALIRRFGPHVGPVTEVLDGSTAFFTSRAIASVSTIDGVAPTGITVIGAQGRIIMTGRFRQAVIVYTPADDTAERKQVIIELVRIAVERTAMKGESVAGEYSYTAPDNWEHVRREQYRRLVFMEI